MLRKIMQITVLGLGMLGLSVTGHAKVKFTPSMNASAFMGLYSNSEKTDAFNSDGTAKADAAEAGSQWDMLWWGELGMKVKEGKMTGYAEISSKSYDIDDIQYIDAWVKLQATEAIAVKVDSDLSPDGTVGFTATSGIGSELTFAKGVTYSLNAYTSQPGMEVEYKPNPYMGVYLGLYAKDPLFDDPAQKKYGYGALALMGAAGLTCPACDTDLILDDDYAGSGNGYSLSFAGALSKQLILGAGYVVGTSEQYDGRTPWASSAYQLSIKYKITGDMSITADYGTRDFEVWKGMKASNGAAVDEKVSFSTMGLMFKTKAGPGELAAIYHSSADKVDVLGSEQKALMSTGQEMTVTYDIAMCSEMRCGTKLIYFSDSVKGAAKGSDTNTQTWMGAQLYTKF